ncbi:MAG: hypothetical protein ACRDTS_19590, partial [Mycobacterium sp.]
VDVTGLPIAGFVVPASMHENDANRVMLDRLAAQGVTGRPELVLVDRGMTAGAASTLSRQHGLEVRRVGWDDKQPMFRPIRHAWRVEVAHGRLGRSRRLAKSFENTTASATGWLQVACIARRFGTSASRGHSPPSCVGWRSRARRGGRRMHVDGGNPVEPLRGMSVNLCHGSRTA